MGFARASAETLAQRRIVVAPKPASKRAEFAKHINGLNHSFYKWLKTEITKDSTADLTNGFQVKTNHVLRMGYLNDACPVYFEQSNEHYSAGLYRTMLTT